MKSSTSRSSVNKGNYVRDEVREASEVWQAAIASMQGEAKPVAWYYRFKNAKGWGLWTISCGSEKPVNVAFEDMEARPLVFGNTYPPSAASKIAEQDARIKELEVMVDALLAHCDDAECYTCGEIVCPYKEPLHFHHDGCPACAQHEVNSKIGGAE